MLAPVTLLATTTTIGLAAAQTAGAPTLESGRAAVGHGERLTLAGGGGTPDAPMTIEFQRAGGERWSRVRDLDADAAGDFRARVRPRYSGSYRALAADGTASAPVAVRVRSKLALDSEPYAVVGRRLRVRGRVQPAGERSVRVTLGGSDERTRANAKGRFSVALRAGDTGRLRPAARAAGDELAAGSSARARRVTVYRPASASWYGPGLYGNSLACGGTLTPGTIGVAHKTLPCGTKVRLRNGSRTVTAPVVDRGPFVGGREYDLTAATKQKLGFGSTGTVLASK